MVCGTAACFPGAPPGSQPRIRAAFLLPRRGAGKEHDRATGDTSGTSRSNGETVMDAIIKSFPKTGLSDHVRAAPEPAVPRPSREEAAAAVRTLIAFAGGDPNREGLLDTPSRVVNAYEELFRGYRECPAVVLERTFSEIGTYNDLVLILDIPFYSHCEHHIAPFVGKAHS